MNVYQLADQVETWGNDLLALNMKGGIPVTEGAKLLRIQADLIKTCGKTNRVLMERIVMLEEECKALREQCWCQGQ